jgi:proline iminopeptidase
MDRSEKLNAPGVEMIQLDEGYKVWTQRVGDGSIKLLTLHGGPGAGHEYFESFTDYFPQKGIQVIYYDQLGCYYSDQPDDESLWTVNRFREEVEQVRTALGLESYYILGSSWGGMLGIEYSLQYQKHLKGIVISNMTASIQSYTEHLSELREQLPPDLVAMTKRYEAEGKFDAPEYEEVIFGNLYKKHLCRLDPWPDAVVRTFDHLAQPVYNTMQGPNEFVVTGNFADWNRWDDLHRITIPTLLIVGRYDTMSVADVEEMGRRIPNSRVVICENGSHLAMWDDAEFYHGEVVRFIEEVEAGTFESGN